jgi:hypothetical protein
MAHLFICPNCGHRTTESDRTAGFRREAKGCGRCGFGFLFELTGLDDERVIGRPVKDVLGLRFDNSDDPVGTVLEWGVRALNKSVEVNAEGDLPARATADLFPAYDEDGGMLLVLTPAK